MGVEKTTLPSFTEFSMIHMKQFVNDLLVENWTNELTYEFTPTLKIATIVQEHPFHYHIKEFNNILKDHYDNRF